MGDVKLTDRQQAFVHWYVKLLNATRAAERAGYASENRHALEQQASRLLSKVEVRTAIDAALKASIPSADAVLTRISQRALADITPYLREDDTLDVQALADAGLGHLVVGVKPGREGVEYTLVSPQTATKNLARYHRLLGSDVQVDIDATSTLDETGIQSLAQQIAAAQASVAQQDDAQDSETE